MTYEVTVSLGGTDYLYTPPGVGGIPDYYVRVNHDGTIRFGLGGHKNGAKDMLPSEPHNLGPHHIKIVSIAGDGARTTVLDKDLAYHGWLQAWVYRPNGLPVPKKTPAQMVALKHCWPMGDVVPPGTVGPMQVKYLPVSVPCLDFSNITRYMPTTGERGDIGWVTDQIANYLLGGSAAGMLAWAEASLAAPVHIKDFQTGRTINPVQYGYTNTYGGGSWYQGGPWIALGVDQGDGKWPPVAPAPAAREIIVQRAHLAELAGWAALVTEDLTYLEEAQDYVIACTLTDRAGCNGKFMVGPSEVRGMGWHLRSILLAWRATVDAEQRFATDGIPWPAHLHPSSLFKTAIDNSLPYWLSFCNAPNNQLFHTVMAISRTGPWQHNYVLTVLPLMLLYGFAEWAPVYKALLNYWIDLTSGESGWPPGWGTHYYFNVAPNIPPDPGLDFVGQAIWNINDSHVDDTKRFSSWAECWAANVQHMKDEKTAQNLGGIPPGDPAEAAAIAKNNADHAAIDAAAAKLALDPTNGGQAMQGHGYNFATCAAGEIASYLEKLGLFPTSTHFPAFPKCLKNVRDYVADGGWMEPRYCVVDDPARAGSKNLQPIYDMSQEPPPVVVDPNAPPPPPPPNYGTAEPPPETDNGARVYTTSKDSVFIDLRGKVPSGSHQLICDITGNGRTDAYVSWPELSHVGWLTLPPELQSPTTTVFCETNGSGDTLPFRGCRSLTVNGAKIWTAIVPDPLPNPTPDPTQPPPGGIEVSEPALNAPFTATAKFVDNTGAPMTPDTVTWEAPAAFALTPDQADKTVAHGVYGASGPAVIKAVGVKGGKTVTLTKEVLVPQAAPFLAGGQIVLS